MVIAFIPARGGSVSIPLKNIKPMLGKPLVYWSLLSIEKSSSIDKAIVATDSEEIKNTVLSFGFKKTVIYDRDKENASSTASTESVMLEYIKKTRFNPNDIFILVQATNPFISSTHFDEAMCDYQEKKYDSILSVVRTKRFFWNESGNPINYNYLKRPRRQDFDGLFMENGAFYINRIKNILENGNRLSGRIGLYEMPEYSGFEIDEIDDWEICESLMKKYVALAERKKIKLFITDVDGVLTDAGMYYSDRGEELKKFNTRDGLGIRLLRESGIKTAIITSEKTDIVYNRAKKLNIDHTYCGISDKLSSAEEICRIEGFGLEETAFIGDDINDEALLKRVSFSACPKDAVDLIKSIPGIKVMNKKGGQGAVREFAEILLKFNKTGILG